MDRRGFLKLLGQGALLAAAAPVAFDALAGEALGELPTYRRRVWQVGRNAPVGGGFASVNQGLKEFYANALGDIDWGDDEVETSVPFTTNNAGWLAVRHPDRMLLEFEAAEPIRAGSLVVVGADGLAREMRPEHVTPLFEAPVVGLCSAGDYRRNPNGKRRVTVEAAHVSVYADERGMGVSIGEV